VFQGLIEEWRRQWRIGDFAFLFVQLAPQLACASGYCDYLFQIRLEQASALPCAGCQTDTTGMATAFDLGDITSPYPPAHVHPRWKMEVARRLALQMLHVQYAIQYPELDFSWPVLSGTEWINSDVLNIVFSTDSGAPLTLLDTKDCWECCSGAGDIVQFSVEAEGPWVNSTVKLNDNSTGLVATPNVLAPDYSFIRYASNVWPQCALYGTSNNIPVNPFQIGITAPPTPEMPAAVSSGHSKRASNRYAVKYDTSKAWHSWKERTIPQPRIDPVTGMTIAQTPPMGYNSWVRITIVS
jgi:hypothetical protein